MKNLNLCSYFFTLSLALDSTYFVFFLLFFTLATQSRMILNISTSLILRGYPGYYQLLKNLDLPFKVLDNTNYYHVHWGGSLMPPLKTINAKSVQQVNYLLM